MTIQKFGIGLPEPLVSRIEERLTPSDSRSQRIRSLVSVGLEAEDVMVEQGLYHPSDQKREQIVREALEQYKPDGETV
jgi:metal-responsive CopG/Arc/MetJ family transcriptional regulator